MVIEIMFKRLSFQNFKSWQDTGQIQMAPITGFFGTNSSGKTAILQFLLMLKQTVESSDRQRILHLGGEDRSYVNLGTSHDFIHQHQLPNTLSFSLSWQPPISKPKLELFTGALSWNLEFNQPYVYKSQNYNHIDFQAQVNVNKFEICVNEMTYQYSLYNLPPSSSGLEIGDRVSESAKLSVSRAHNNDSYSFSTDPLLLPHFSQEDSPFLKHPSSSLTNIYRFPDDLIKEANRGYLLSSLEILFENLFENLYYLGPIRAYPSRIYLWSGEQPQDVGRRGEWTIPALLAAQKSDPGIVEKVAHWLRELNLIHSFTVEPIAPNRREYEVRIRQTANAADVLLTDVGFGVSQILPVLVLCYYVPEGASVILEQPEIHLHPSAQTGLADILIEVAKTRKLQIILESHSEHLLRRLQRRIAEETFPSDDVALYFCAVDPEGRSNLTPLQVDEFGNISNWPDHFFGDEMGDLFAMTEANMKRQLAQENPAQDNPAQENPA